MSNGKGSRQRTPSDAKFRAEHERIFKVDENAECLKEFMEDDLEDSQVDAEEFVHDRKRNES